MDWTKLKELLEAEQYPHRYLHKFIGKKTQAFFSAVSGLEAKFPRATRLAENDAKGGSYVALTYEFVANSADEIIELLKATCKLTDIKIIL